MTTEIEVEMTGLGGGGVMVASQLFALAAAASYKYVSVVPNYASAQRGGKVQASITFSNEEIACPTVVQTQYVLIFSSSQFQAFEDTARPGGTIVVDSRDFNYKPKRKDIEILAVPAMDTALKMNYMAGSNLILLGAFIGAKEVVSPKFVEAELEKRFGARKDVLSLNMQAFREGLKIGTQLKRK